MLQRTRSLLRRLVPSVKEIRTRHVIYRRPIIPYSDNLNLTKGKFLNLTRSCTLNELIGEEYPQHNLMLFIEKFMQLELIECQDLKFMRYLVFSL